MKNKQMRITIDGPSNTGKTLLAWKIAEFLQTCGVSGENITFFNDNAEQINDPLEIERRLNSGLSGGMWQHTDFAIVERAVAPSRSAMGQAWAAKPEVYSPVFRNTAHVNLEMGRTPEHYTSPPLAEELKSAMERLNLREGTQKAFIEQILTGAHLPGAVAVNTAANLLTHKPVLDMIANADGRKEGNEARDEILDTFLGLGALRAIDAGPFTKVDPLMRFGGINRIMADPELKARVIEYLEQSSPFDLESSFDPSKAVHVSTLADLADEGREEALVRTELSERGLIPTTLAEVREWLGATGKVAPTVRLSTVYTMRAGWDKLRLELAINSGDMSDAALDIAKTVFWSGALAFDQKLQRNEAAMSSHCGTVLGTPLGRNNGDHNGELETGYKYQREIHPVTGETRDQMLMRAQPFVKTAHVREHVLLDYSDLPRDLVFDQQCGVRWQTEEELARIGMRYPNVLEFKHQGVRLMPNLTEPTTQPGKEIVNAKPSYSRNGVADVSSGEDLSMKKEYKFPVYPHEQVVRGADGEVLKTWVPTPRGMNRVFASIDDQAFIERPDHPLDPLLDVVFTPPDSSFQTTPEMEARRALRNTLLSEQLSDAATNLGKIADVSSSGQVQLPKTDE
jgi:hypothetical protein